MRRRRRTLAAIGAVLGLLASACSTPEVLAPSPSPDTTTAPPGGRHPGGTLRIGLAADPQTLDPRFLVDEEGELIVGAVFEPLVRLTPAGQPVPGAASAWEVSEDATTFTLTLREATFHDGTAVTAADVKRTFDRIADGVEDPPSFLAYLLEPIEGFDEAQTVGDGLDGVEVLDTRTVRITLREPQPRFLHTLADPSLVPTPGLADEDPQGFAERPVGNGPFALASTPEPGGFVRLTRVGDHHRAPLLDEVVLQLYPDDPARDRQWDDLVDGLLQVADVGPSHLDDAVREFGVSEDGFTGPGLLDGPTATVYMLGFDTTAEPFDDPLVRRAISQSIDRERLADEVLGGTRRAADRIVPEGIPGSQPGVCDHCRTDPEGAAALLADASVELPDTLTFTHNRGSIHAAIAARVAEDVSAALDVEVTVQPMDLHEFVPAVSGGDAPWFRLGWETNLPDPGAYLDPLFHSRNLGLDNLTGYADRETDELLDVGRTAEDLEVAHDAYQAAEQRILEAVPVAPLLVHERSKVVAPDVEGLRWSPTGRVDLARVRLASSG
jgi:oligopeptide transport system substrate-binding protein